MGPYGEKSRGTRRSLTMGNSVRLASVGLVGALAAGAFLVLLPSTRAQQAPQNVARQPGAVYDFDRPNERPAPAPKRDISGVWEPATGPGGGIHANGAGDMPSDGKPEHELPFTAEGRAAFAANKPTFGITMVPSASTMA